MAKKKEEPIKEEIVEEAGEPAIFLRKVDVVICNGEDEEPTSPSLNWRICFAAILKETKRFTVSCVQAS